MNYAYNIFLLIDKLVQNFLKRNIYGIEEKGRERNRREEKKKKREKKRREEKNRCRKGGEGDHQNFQLEQG
jgi:hypothetical protein